MANLFTLNKATYGIILFSLLFIPGAILYIYGVKFDNPIQYIGIIICGASLSIVILYCLVVIIIYLTAKCERYDIIE